MIVGSNENNIEKKIRFFYHNKMDIRLIEGNFAGISNNLKKMIEKFTRERNKLISKYDKNYMDSLPAIYAQAEDDIIKSDIEEKMLYYHFPIAIIIIKKYAKHVDIDTLDDLFQHCMFSIINALRRYDPKKNTLFHTYLARTMLGEILKFLDTTRLIRFNYYYVKSKMGEEYVNDLYVIMESNIISMSNDENHEFFESYNFNKNGVSIYNLIENENDYVYDTEYTYNKIVEDIRNKIMNSQFTEKEKMILLDLFMPAAETGIHRNTIKKIAAKYKVKDSYVHELKQSFIEYYENITKDE